MTEMELMLPTARNRPRRCEPDRIATIQRTGFLARRGRGPVLVLLRREVAGQGGQLAARLGGQRPAGPLLELVQGQPADGGVVAEHAQGLVPLGVGDPEGIVRVGHGVFLPRRVAQQGTPGPGYAGAGP